MVRWRYCLVLAMLLLLPLKTIAEDEDDDDIVSSPEDESDDNDSDDNDEEEATEKTDIGVQNRRIPPAQQATAAQPSITRTIVARRPLECYVCAYKADTQLKSCLDPTKHRVHTMTCHSIDEKCFTSVMSKGSTYETVMRGCRSACVGSPEITCCELNRCNNQAFAMPVAPVKKLVESNKSTKALPQTVLFFVTVLLVLQTVVKVAVV